MTDMDWQILVMVVWAGGWSVFIGLAWAKALEMRDRWNDPEA